MTKATTRERLSISVRGVVQGVGFRPFVYQLATRHGLRGWVCNTSGDVKIEVEGDSHSLEHFVTELQTQAPPLARIESLAITPLEPAGYSDFQIRHSIAEADKYQLVSPDIATCQPCLKEIFDPQDRRYRYPFTNCTNCGPRFTIIEDIPYDRPLTTMRPFQMCPQCQREYDNPLDRRFHAQPNACPRCGPRLELVDSQGRSTSSADPIAAASRFLREGKVVAVKGLGGFLLACDATNEDAVQLLRRRKRRPFKPFAIMVSTIEEARQHCRVSPEEERLLLSSESPIVLMSRKEESSIAPGVAPNLKYLGVMLPYTPLHHLLLRETGLPLVMTSGNLSEEPIAKDNDEALRRLGNLADYFLIHNRDIYARYDDSVTIVERGERRVLRRARGYAPYPIHLPFQARQILACGAELKNTFCLTRENHAFISQHIGDLENLETLEHFENTIELYKKLFRIQPEAVAYDLHPEYLSTKYAKELQAKHSHLKFVAVQHYHAHIASCMAENGVSEPVIGVSLDGTGYGSDGLIWGGEFLVADYKGFRRWGHLENMPLPGGAAAIKRPYRMALAYLFEMGLFQPGLAFLKNIPSEEISIVKAQVAKRLNSPLTSSMGRLFDGVAALVGIRGEIDYEAQAAIEMEMLSAQGISETYPFAIEKGDDKYTIKLAELFQAIIADMQKGTPDAVIAARFHNTVARMVVRMCQLVSQETGLKTVALSGGVFQNRLLFRLACAELEGAGFRVLTHSLVPANDGGISLGQAVVANAMLS